MTSEQWEQVKEWFDRLADLPAEARAEALGAVEDTAVALEAARLLALHGADCPELEKLKPPVDWARDAVDLRAFRNGDLAAGRFKILRFLAAGGMGEVYEAEDLELHERVAVKTLRPELALTESAYARFKQEIQLSRKVTHPNVCRIHDLWRHSRTGGRSIHFLTMELLAGETLASLLEREGRMAPATALEIVRQMVEGLEAAHAAGVVHRDLKPSNVMLTGERVVITDFGLSRSLSAAAVTLTGSTLGTPAYMAPEQIESGETGPATDIYSLGVVIYEMVTGVLPFRGGSAMALAVKKLRETPAPPSSLAEGLSPEWDRAILACLTQEPSFRFQSARALLMALEGSPDALIPRRRRGRIATWVWQAAFAGSLVVLAVLLYPHFIPRYRPGAEALRWYERGVEALHEESHFKAKQLLEKSVEADPRFAAAHARLAQAFSELDMADRAREELLRAADLQGRDEVLVDAIRKFVLRDFGAAALLFQRLEPGTGAALDTARAMAMDRNVDGAAKRYSEVLKAEPENAAALLQLGGGEVEPKKALEAYAKADEVFRLRGNLEGMTTVALRRSERLVLSKNLALSEEELKGVLAMARATGNLYLETETLGRLGTVSALAGRFAEACELAEQVAELARVHGFANLRARSLFDLGYAFLAQFQYEKAEPMFRRSLKVAEEGRLRLAAANSRLRLAQVLIRQSKTKDAEPFLTAAEEYFRKANHISAMLVARMTRVDAFIEDGKNDQALAEAKAGFSESQRLGYGAEGIPILLRVAHMAIVSGDLPAAFAIHRQVRPEYERLGQKAQYVRSLLNEGRLRVSGGDLAEARTLAAEAERRIPDLGGNGEVESSKLHAFKAYLATAEGKGEAALAEVRQAVRESGGETAILEARAQILLGRGPEAVISARRAVTATEKGSVTARAEMRCGLAEAYYSNSEDGAAIRESGEALKNGGENAQILIRVHCLLVLRAALGRMRDARYEGVDTLARKEFEQFTKAWSAESRERFRKRADLRKYFVPGELR